MQCSLCGGLVIWKGPFSNLTHTECQSCGAINSQLPDDHIEEEDEYPPHQLSLRADD